MKLSSSCARKWRPISATRSRRSYSSISVRSTPRTWPSATSPTCTARLDALAADVTRVLGDVRLAISDWTKMRDRVLAIVKGLDQRAPPIPPAELAEGQAFLLWLADNHFTFLGCRSHELATVDGQDVLKVVPDSSLGILREVQPHEAS